MDAYNGVTPVLDLDYTYDLAGNITNVADAGGDSRGRNYAYDPLHRLTQGQELTPGGATVALQTDYTYDAVGNRTTRNVGGAVETYSYDPASNRLLSVLAGGVTRAFTYSASGNVTVDDPGGAAMVLTYNAADRLVKVSAGAVTLVEYVYAATGQRASKTTTSNITHYLYDPGGALYAETDGAGTVLREYITLGGATVAIVDSLGMSFVHNDHLATPQVMTDGAAAVVWDASYRPFGEATIAGAVANEQRFPGQTADAETGYHDNWHRTYDPSLGRYLQSDPIGIGGGWNTYAYANGNPVMLSDRMGLRSLGGALGRLSGVRGGGGGAGLVTAVAGRLGRVALTLGGLLSAACLAAYPPIIPTAGLPMGWIPASWIPKWPSSWRERDAPPPSGDNSRPPLPLPYWPWRDDDGSGGDGQGPIIIEQDGDAIEIVAPGVNGDITIMANMTNTGDTLYLDKVHIDGVGEGTSSISELRRIAREFGKQQGVQEVVITGGTRTTGANPGKQPIPIRIKVE